MRIALTLAAVTVSAAAVVSGGAQPAAGLRWTVPAGWTTAPAQPMRAATYAIAPATGDKAPAECGVYFFGAGQGGGITDNIDRWKGQFHGPDGKPAAATVSKKTIRGLNVTTIETSGEYSGMAGPMANSRPVPGYSLLGAIVEGPGGNIFVKFTGPSATVAANRSKFDALLNSFQPAP